MSFAALLTQTATLVHHPATGTDSEGNTTFGTATTTTYPCLLQQREGKGIHQAGSTEVVQGETRTDTLMMLFLPASAAGETFEDEVLVDGLRYQVEGQPDVLRTPRGVHHVETRLRRISP
jgi:hypothetical protein